MSVEPVYVRFGWRFIPEVRKCPECKKAADAQFMKRLDEDEAFRASWSWLWSATGIARLEELADICCPKEGAATSNSAKINRVRRWFNDVIPDYQTKNARLRRDDAPGRDLQRRVDALVQMLWIAMELPAPEDYHPIKLRRRTVEDLLDWFEKNIDGWREEPFE